MADPSQATEWEYFFKYIVPAATGIITVAVACVTSFIAKKQFDINKAQKEILAKKQTLETEEHQLKKHDRNIEIFVALEIFFGDLEAKGKIDHENMAHFYKSIWPNRFLYSKEIKEYFYKLREAMFKSHRISTGITHARDENKWLKLYSEEDELMHWFTSQRQNLDEKFEPYLLVQQ